MRSVESTSADTIRQQSNSPQRQATAILAGLLAIACLVAWFQGRSLASTRDTHYTALRQLEQMSADAERIIALRQAPKSATSRRRANEELLAQIERALATAGIDRSQWHDSIPQPPIRLPNSDYKKLTTRLYFQAITPRQLAAFSHHLESTDPTLRLTALNLTNRHHDSPNYDIDLAVSYLVYAPQQRDKQANP